MISRRFAVIAAVLLLGIVIGQSAFAAGRNYVDRRRVIRVGVLIPQTNAVSGATALPIAPYLFYIMDQRIDVKPAGWSFMNPLAGGRDIFKNYAAYWAVPLRETTLENLAKFDVLYMNAATKLEFQMADRDKLRRFVDGGGCLWLDNGGTGAANSMSLSSNPAYAFFLPGVDFVSGGSGSPVILAALHPLLTNPFWLGPQEVGAMNWVTGMVVNPGYTGNMLTSSSTQNDLPNPTTLYSLVSVSSTMSLQPTVACIEYGSGRVVVTSGFVGGGIQGPVYGTGAMNSVPSNANMLAANPASLKFAYNVIAWASSCTTLRKNYRHDGVSLENVGAPLINKWKLPAATASGTVETSPVVWKNIIYYSSGNTIYAVDAVPEEDLDMNGNPDDGQPDAPGSTVDIIWQAQVPGCNSISSPTVASMIDPLDMKPRDFVFVTGDDDKLVHVFEALPTIASGGGGIVISGTPVDRSLSSAAPLWGFPSGNTATPDPGLVLSPPIVQNGWIYAAGPQGKVYGYSPVYAAASGIVGNGIPGYAWSAPIIQATGSNPAYGTIKSALMLGYVKNRQTGAVAQTLSFAGKEPDPGGGTIFNDFLFSLPVFVSSDKLSVQNPQDLIDLPSTGVRYRISYNGVYVSEYPAPQIWAVDTDGVAHNVSLFDTTTNSLNYGGQPGVVNLKASGLGATVRVYMSYGVDYAKSINSYAAANFDAWQLQPVVTMGANLTPRMTVTGSPALGPNDAFYTGVNWDAASATSNAGYGTGHSALYCVGFEGKGSPGRLKWPYFLHGGGTFANPRMNPSQPSTGPLPLSQLDSAHKWGIFSYVRDGSDPTGYARMDPSGHPYDFVRQPVQNLEVVGTPAVTNERVFVTATSKDPGNNLSKSYLLCFKSDPTFQIRCNRPFKDVATGDHRTVSVWQPDLLFSSSGNGDVSMLARQIGGEMVDYDTGTITVTDFDRVRLRTYLPNSTSMIVDGGILSPSLPVWVFIDNNPIPIEQIDFSSWNNLLWAMPIPDHPGGQCSGISGSPVVLGDYVYFSCDDGYMYAVDAAATPMDSDFRLLLQPLPPAGDNKYNDTLAQWDARVPMRDKVDQNAIAGPGKSSMAGAGGLLAVPSTAGLYVFNNPITLVTDNHRVMEIGGDGKVTWACDSVYEPKVVNPALSASVMVDPQSLNKPVVAQKFGGSDYLVVDSGNDRVIRMDRGGQVTWSLKDFKDPREILRSGEPKTIKNPADARMWSETEVENGNWFYVIHCVVVDTGHFRLLDVVDRFVSNEQGQIQGPENDANGNPIGHQLRWVSNTTYKDKRFDFNSIQLVRGSKKDKNGNSVETDQIWTSVSNFGLGNSDIGDIGAVGGGHLGGAILALDYRDAAGNFKWAYGDGLVKAELTTVTDAAGQNPKMLSSPRFFQVLSSAEPRLLICDSSAVYETLGTDGRIQWQLDETGYQGLKRKIRTKTSPDSGADTDSIKVPFSPYRAQKLGSSGRYLIVNSYAGRTQDPRMVKFTGEVFEISVANNVRDDNMYWFAPDMVWTPGSPPDIVQKMYNAPNLDQPTCAQRQ